MIFDLAKCKVMMTSSLAEVQKFVSPPVAAKNKKLGEHLPTSMQSETGWTLIIFLFQIDGVTL